MANKHLLKTERKQRNGERDEELSSMRNEEKKRKRNRIKPDFLAPYVYEIISDDDEDDDNNCGDKTTLQRMDMNTKLPSLQEAKLINLTPKTTRRITFAACAIAALNEYEKRKDQSKPDKFSAFNYQECLKAEPKLECQKSDKETMNSVNSESPSRIDLPEYAMIAEKKMI